MLKQSSSRNLRTKGIRLKTVFQICALGAICIWLLYQMNKSHHSSNNNTPAEEIGTGNSLPMLKLGRKGLNPEIEDESGGDQLQKPGDDEAEFEDEEKKLRAELEEDERKLRETEGDEDDDESEQDKTEEVEPEQLEDLIGEEDKEK